MGEILEFRGSPQGCIFFFEGFVGRLMEFTQNSLLELFVDSIVYFW